MEYADQISEAKAIYRNEVTVDPRGQIEELLEVQHVQLQKLEEEIIRLHGRLDPVLIPTPSKDNPGNDAAPMPVRSSIADRIAHRNYVIISLQERVGAIYRSVDL
jgi:hypothetical protein